MKGCFILQRNFAYIGHNLALLLKEKYGITEWCGYVYMRTGYDFLKKQTDIRYTSLLLDQDIHQRYTDEVLDLEFLKKLEVDYGIPNLWPYIMLDRVVMSNQLVREYPYNQSPYSYEEILRIVQVKAKAIIEFLDKEKPDFLVVSVIGAIGSMLLYQICKKRGIKTIVTQNPMIKGRFGFSETYDSLTEVDKAMKAGQKPKPENQAQARKFIDNFRATPHPHWELGHPSRQPVKRSQQFAFLKPKNLFSILRWMSKYFITHFKSIERYDYDYIGPWNYLKDAVLRKARNIVGSSDLLDEVNTKDTFAFFPLHFEPEISLSLYSPFYTDQISIIKYFARSLPVGYYLYVKEHPAMVVYRPRAFYKELKKIPNVKLINPLMTSFEITRNAKIITTISGTVGWEACLLQKPVITIGDVFYNKLSFVKNCRTMEELPGMVQQQLQNFAYDDAELERFVGLLFEETTDVNLQYLWEIETDQEKRKVGLMPFADLLAKTLKLDVA